MKLLKVSLAAFVLMVTCVSLASAQDAPMTEREKAQNEVDKQKATNWGIGLGAGLGAGLTILGAGFGISGIGGRAVESMARQPEVAGNVQGAMVVSAALIEGVSFFSLIVCILIVFFA